MPIHAYSGLPGSGKSYSVVEKVVIDSIKKNRRIVTNLPLKLDVLYNEYPNAQVKTIDLATYSFDLDEHQEDRGAVFVLDEIWKKWPNGMRTVDMSNAHKTYFAEHRHFVGEDGQTTEIILVTQSLVQICSYIRELTDTTFITSKLDKIGLDKKFRIDIYSGAQNLQRPNHEQLIRQGYSKYDKNIFKFYRSHTHNDTDFTSGIENSVDKRANLLTSLGFVGGCLLALIGISAGFYYFFGVFGDTSEYHKGNNVQAHTLPPLNPPINASLSQPPGNRPVRKNPPPDSAPLSENWRIAAILHGEKVYATGAAVLYNENSKIYRTIPLEGHCSTIRKTKWEWECIVDNQIITYWTGHSSNKNSFL